MKYAKRFLQKYKYLSREERCEIILEFHGEPYTWNPIMIEVRNDTAIGEKMLEQLVEEGKL